MSNSVCSYSETELSCFHSVQINQPMPELCDLQIHVNGQQTFFLNEKIISKFSGKLRRIINQEKRRTQIKNSGIEIEDFPGGPDGFELISRFCYNKGRVPINVSNVSVLHCCALFLGMTEKISPNNLFRQTEIFLKQIFHWSWNDTLICLESCESVFLYADSSGLIENLINSLISKIFHNSDPNSPVSSSSSSSPELLSNPSSNSNKSWWFEELTILPPVIIQKFIKTLDSYGTYNNTIITRFLLYYLKTSSQSKLSSSRSSYGGLADRAVYGVILMGKRAFSCRGLFWVLRIVSGFGVSRDYRGGIERLIGGVLDEAKLDDLLVSGGGDGGVYDVSLVVRLIRVFVCNYDKVGGGEEKIRKVGGLVDKYLREIGADHKLKMSKFLGVAESLPQSARDCFDGVYRAVDIYLESHPSVTMEERSRICRCVNYKKLSLEACKDLAKNPRFPPLISIQALASQHSNIIHNIPKEDQLFSTTTPTPTPPIRSKSKSNKKMVLYNNIGDEIKNYGHNNNKHGGDDEEEEKDGLMRMKWRVVELEKACRDINGQISILGKTSTGVLISSSSLTRTLPRLC